LRYPPADPAWITDPLQDGSLHHLDLETFERRFGRNWVSHTINPANTVELGAE
jgi:hypothetical protein